ncbi:MAG: lipoprotein [Candidatus Sericytochromatia bacterium]
MKKFIIALSTLLIVTACNGTPATNSSSSPTPNSSVAPSASAAPTGTLNKVTLLAFFKCIVDKVPDSKPEKKSIMNDYMTFQAYPANVSAEDLARYEKLAKDFLALTPEIDEAKKCKL